MLFRSKEIENPENETFEFLFIYFFFWKGWVEFGYIVFGLNESQWVFS